MCSNSAFPGSFTLNTGSTSQRPEAQVGSGTLPHSETEPVSRLSFALGDASFPKSGDPAIKLV